jgi:hypothetical protein
VLVGRIRRRENVSERKPDARVGRDAMEGLRFVFDNRPLRGMVMSAGSADLLMGISSAMFIVLLATLPDQPAVHGILERCVTSACRSSRCGVFRTSSWVGSGDDRIKAEEHPIPGSECHPVIPADT